MQDNTGIGEIIRKIENERNQKPDDISSLEIEFEIGTPCDPPVPTPAAQPEAVMEEPPVPEAPVEEESPLFNIFDIADEEENSATINNDVFKVNTVYMPTFTNVSDHFYRYGTVPESQEPSPDEDTPAVEAPTAELKHIDAVAELDDATSYEARLVETAEEKVTVPDTVSTVFKFEDDSGYVQEQPQELPPSPEPVPEPEPEPEPEPIPEPAVEAPLVVEQPLKKRLPERFVPQNPSPVETIARVGDEIAEGAKREYESESKRDIFKDRFLDTLTSQKVRFFVALAISLILIVFENIGIFGVDLISAFNFDANPQALAIIDIQFTTCIVLLALPELIVTLKALFKRKPTTDLFIFPAYMVYIAYSVIVIVNMPSEYPMFGILCAVYALSLISSASFKTNADFVSFKKISEPDDKMIVDNKYTRTLPRENMALDGLIEEYKSKIARTFRTSFVADFFRRTARMGESVGHLLLLLLPPLGTAGATALICYFIGDGIMSAITAFSLVFLFSLPVFSLFVHKLPQLHATLKADAEQGAIIGERSFFDYSGVDVICFDDTDVFDSEDVNIQRIMLYGNRENLPKAVRQMSALFMNVGGPLDAIFAESLDRRCEPANGVCIMDNGIIGEIDGKKVMAGSYDFMISEGVSVPADDDGMRRDATKIMYAAENGVVYAKFYIRYRFSEEFTMLMPILKEEGIVPLVYTRDPNVNNELLKILTAGLGTIRILKKSTTPNRDFAPSRISAGMVSNGDKSNLLNLILLSRKYVRFNQQMKTIERYAMITGLALGIVLSLGGMSLLIPSFVLAIWHCGWCVALSCISRKYFRPPEREKKPKHEKKKKEKK